jgi:hypothetical protein
MQKSETKGYGAKVDLTCSEIDIERWGQQNRKDLTITTTFEFAEKDTMPGIDIFLITLCAEREYTRKSGP